MPKTTGTYENVLVKFKGRNPGDLRQDVRSMSTPNGATKNTKKGIAPKNKEGVNMKNNKYIVLVIILMFKTAVAVGQDKTNEISIVKHFVEAVFLEKNKAQFIADNFIYFEPTNNMKYSESDRIKILTRHLKKIRKEKDSLFDSTDFQIVTYDTYKNDKVYFSKTTNNIFILLSKNNPVMYFYLINDRVLSFDYIIKGNEGLFITY